MSCGQPCWTCGQPIPSGRHSLSAIRRVFCTEECRVAFSWAGSAVQRGTRETFCSNCGHLDEPGVHKPDCPRYCEFCYGEGDCVECDPETAWK